MRILNEGMRLAGRYTLTRRLGAGGMAEVWLATDARAQTRVALKFLSGTSAGDPARQALLKREWQIGSRLMHPNIARVFEYHDDPDGAYYSLQYLGKDHLGSLEGASPDESLRPVSMIADALRYAHGKGVVHRDIKASNILLDRRGIPYLVDFGVAAAPGSEAISGGGSSIASSPQQDAGESASAADDIYSLGVVMHELLTGQPPDRPPNASASATLHDGQPVPPALQELLDDMLAREADKRPDAEGVTSRLAAAGYAPGPAPARFVGGAATNEVVESVAAVPKPGHAAARTTNIGSAAGKPAGISPRILAGGLTLALALFLAVIFVLPQLVGTESSSQVDAPDAPLDAESPVPDRAAMDETDSPGVERPDVTVPSPATPASENEGTTSFNENVTGSAASGSAREKAATDEALGDLLSQLERLRYRAIDRWGGQDYLDAVDVYAEGDRAYLDRNYRLAGERYRKASEMLEPFFDRIDTVFADTLAAAKEAFDAGDHAEAIRLFDLAASITPGNREAEAGLSRASKQADVLSLMDQGKAFEEDLEFAGAKLAYEKALALDELWEPAATSLVRVKAAIRQLSFEQRMTEGFAALAAKEFDSARAAFNAAKALNPTSNQPSDGLLQLDQEIRLADIRRLEAEASRYDAAEQWETSVAIYQNILKIDPDLQFAKDGLAFASSRSALHARLNDLISSPDTLSDPVNMQSATNLLLDLTRIDPMGPRLEDQKSELSRLLKRAATPLSVRLESDNMTQVSIFKVGRFGTFATHELSLRPGLYVAVGVRPGYRDVRVEFRVAPEIDLEPIVVRCEEQI